MNWQDATNQQLFVILSEDCPLAYKYKAAFELQERKEKSESQKVSHFKGLAAYSGKSYKFNS